MPTYRYHCLDCGYFEQWQDINAKEYPPCPNCGNKGVAKVFIAPAVAFHGPGFYSTDKKK